MPRKTATSAPIDTEKNWIEELIAGKRPKRIDLDQLQKLLAEYPNHDGTLIYAYRVDPPINQKIIGIEESNIQKLRHPYPANLREFFKTLHGGGTYQLLFHDANLEYEPVAKTFIEIPLSEADPNLDPRVLIRGKPHVEQLIQKWINEGKIVKDKDGNVLPAGAFGAQQVHIHENGKPDPLSSDVVNHALKRVIDKAFDPGTPAAPGANDQLIAYLLDQSRRQHEMQMLLLTKMMEQKNTPAPDPMASLGAVLDVTERIRKIGGKGGGRTDWTEKLANVLTPLGPALESLAQRIVEPAAADPAAPRPAQVAAPPGTQTAPDADRKYQANQQLGQLILNVMRRGQSGADLAVALDVVFGPDAYESLKQLGAAGIARELEVYAPAQWREIAANRETFDHIIDEFLAAFDETDGEESDERESSHV
jgi:hypothetical protein